MMLVITNGSSAGNLVSQVLPDSTVLTWDDVLHDGPVPTTDLDDLADIRARFIAQSGWGNEIDVRGAFQKRNNTIRRYRDYDEVCLFFEHDLYDQLQLCEVLNFFSTTDSSAVPLSIAVDNVYIGEQSPETVGTLLESRQLITPDELHVGASFWKLFTSRDHSELQSLNADPLPFLADAIRRLMEEYPSTQNGLARSRQQILQCLSNGAVDPVALFRQCAAMEEARYLGDASFWSYLLELERCAIPMVETHPGGFLLPEESESFKQQMVALTESGKRVLAGDMDYIEANGTDRWIGGVHVTTNHCPRWNPETETLTYDRV